MQNEITKGGNMWITLLSALVVGGLIIALGVEQGSWFWMGWGIAVIIFGIVAKVKEKAILNE